MFRYERLLPSFKKPVTGNWLSVRHCYRVVMWGGWGGVPTVDRNGRRRRIYVCKLLWITPVQDKIFATDEVSMPPLVLFLRGTEIPWVSDRLLFLCYTLCVKLFTILSIQHVTILSLIVSLRFLNTFRRDSFSTNSTFHFQRIFFQSVFCPTHSPLCKIRLHCRIRSGVPSNLFPLSWFYTG